ncbi:hypothetical protein H5410_046637, partial [Solanum commersonii]
TAEILYEEIKPPIQEEIRKIEIPSFYANKRIIGISTIIQELANNYLNENVIWSYYSRDQLMIYSNSRELRKADMDEVQRWILSLLKPDQLMIYSNLRELRKADMDEVQKWILSLLKLEERPMARALKAEFISPELLTRYCKLIRHKYPDHLCTNCNEEDNVISDVQLE